MALRLVLESPPDGLAAYGASPRLREDDGLRCTADSLAWVQDRFQGYCPHHILHNLLGGHYSRATACNAAPFQNVACRHGSHERPSWIHNATAASTPAVGAVIFLPFELSYRAGVPDSLTNGCAECECYGDSMACAACRVAHWHDGHVECAKPDHIQQTANVHSADCGARAQGSTLRSRRRCEW